MRGGFDRYDKMILTPDGTCVDLSPPIYSSPFITMPSVNKYSKANSVKSVRIAPGANCEFFK